MLIPTLLQGKYSKRRNWLLWFEMERYQTICKGIPATQFFWCPTLLVPQSQRYI